MKDLHLLQNHFPV